MCRNYTHDTEIQLWSETHAVSVGRIMWVTELLGCSAHLPKQQQGLPNYCNSAVYSHFHYTDTVAVKTFQLYIVKDSSLLKNKFKLLTRRLQGPSLLCFPETSLPRLTALWPWFKEHLPSQFSCFLPLSRVFFCFSFAKPWIHFRIHYKSQSCCGFWF